MTLESFVAGIGQCAALSELSRLRAGTRLRLRLAARPHRAPRLEVVTMEGHRLGWLPEEDAWAIEALGAEPAAAAVRIVAIMPGFQRPRIQIRIVLPVRDGHGAPARPPATRPCATSLAGAAP